MAPAEPAVEGQFRGIVLMCSAVAVLAVMAAIFKYLAPDYPTVQIVWARYFFHFALVLVLVPRRIPRLLVSQRKDLQVLRSVLMLGATVCSVIGMRYLPLADFAAIGFVAPLLVALLSIIVLGETVGVRGWISLSVGFAGVLIVVRPGAGVMNWAVALPIGMALCYASYQIITRGIRELADPFTSLIYTAFVGTLATSAVLPFVWVPPDLEGWALLICVGVFGGFGHLALIRAYKITTAALLAPFGYTNLLWAIALGVVLFNDIPDVWTLVGATVIAASGLYIVQRERGRSRLPA
jgi:drug/metabolite transporter (DMT)-like permease